MARSSTETVENVPFVRPRHRGSVRQISARREKSRHSTECWKFNDKISDNEIGLVVVNLKTARWAFQEPVARRHYSFFPNPLMTSLRLSF